MASASPVTSKFYLIKWIFVETMPIGDKIRNFSVSKLHADQNLTVWLNDFEDSYLSLSDCKVFSDLIENRINGWIKVIGDPKRVENSEVGFKYQAAFLCLECKNENQINTVSEVLKQNGQYEWRRLVAFPWNQDTFVSEVVTYQDH